MPDQGRRAPDWAWDEIVLACDLVARNDRQQLPAEDPRVIELSRLLQTMSIHPDEVRGDKFRNPNGVGRKTADLATSAVSTGNAAAASSNAITSSRCTSAARRYARSATLPCSARTATG
jgi:hypothetical protein